MADRVSNLIVRLTDGVSGPARAAANALKGIRTAIVGVDGMSGGDRLAGMIARNNAALATYRLRMIDAAAAGYALTRAIAGPINAAMEFESAMADVRKVVDFPTPAAFNEMSAAIIEMSRRLPMAAKDIASIVASAGQAGMAGDEIMKFAEMAVKVGIAFDMTAEQTGQALAEMKTALRLSVDETQYLADAINELSNKSASSAPAIITFMQKIGSAASQFGFSAEQAAAFGSAMISAGTDAEVAGTSFLAMGRALTKGYMATKQQDEAFEKLGLNAKKVAKGMQEDAVATTLDVLKRIRENVKPEERAAVMSALFGDLARAIAPLVENQALLEDSLDVIAEKASYVGSSLKEYEARARTTANSMQLFRNQISAVGIAIGAALLPALNSIMATLGPIIGKISEFASANPRLTATIVALSAGLIGLRVAAIGFGYVGTMMVGALLSISSVVTSLIPGLAALRVAFMFTGVGAVLTGIAAAGTFIYNNWSGLVAFFQGLGSTIAPAIAVFRPMYEAVAPLVTAVGEIGTAIWNLLGPINATEAEWRAWGEGIGQSIASWVTYLDQLPEQVRQKVAFAAQVVAAAHVRFYEAGVEMINGLWNGLKAGFNNVLSWASSAGSQIASRLSSAASGVWGSIKGAASSAYSTVTGGGSSPAPSGRRARGGPVSRGGSYLVGEHRPEIFTPNRSGAIAPSAGGGGSATINFAPVFNINAPSGAPEQMAEYIRRVMRDEVRETFRGVFADTGMRFA
jgi:TP901 family phage tail tape measure protein